MQNTSKFHIGLHVSDINKTIAFYELLFNQAPSKIKTDYAKFELEDPGLVISFSQTGEVQTGFGHMGIRVNSSKEVKVRKSKLEQFINIDLEEKNTICCYAKQDKFWISDPDGYQWEVYYFIEDDNQPLKNSELQTCC